MLSMDGDQIAQNSDTLKYSPQIVYSPYTQYQSSYKMI